MIKESLTFVVNLLDQYLQNSSSSGEPVAKLTSVDTNEEANKGVSVSLISIEEDRVNPPQGRRGSQSEHVNLYIEPIKLNLFILISASFSDYGKALEKLDEVIKFFLLNSAISSEQQPEMPEPLKLLRFEMVSTSLDQSKDIWSFLGGKYIPSVVYRIRGVYIDPDVIRETAASTKPSQTDMQNS